MKINYRSFLYLLLINLVLIIALVASGELYLRIFEDYPKGTFLGWMPGKNGLYPENKEILMPGPIPYTVKTNSFGFRGAQILPAPNNNQIRIAAIGDSVTDGFYVDNEYTYPYLLQEHLNGKGRRVEVINASHGGGSIDKELAILKKHVIPLKPEIVLLTFVTNDIADILGKQKEDLINSSNYLKKPNLKNTLSVSNSAIGEFLYDAYLNISSPIYRQSKEMVKTSHDRYLIAGGTSFEKNSKIFMDRFKKTDGAILNEPFSAEVNFLIENYLFALKEFKNICEEHNIDLLFIYFPAYSQVYDYRISERIQSILSAKASELSIRYLDLTPEFRRKGKDRALHLAPLDYHLNPDGNKVMAKEIADYLVLNMLDRS